jgi:hypothetical protein
LVPQFRKCNKEIQLMMCKWSNLFTSAGCAAFALCASTVSAQVSLGTAANFAVLAGTAVTCTDSTVEGNVGADLGGPVVQTGCPILGTVSLGDDVAQQANDDFLVAYAALALVPCDVNLTGQSLIGMSLKPGVYCFDVAVTETGGVLTLDGTSADNWIFQVGTSGTGALTGTNFSVVMPGGNPCDNNVSWWVADAATLTDSVFVGSLTGSNIVVTRGTLDGQALAKEAVTLTGTAVCAAA